MVLNLCERIDVQKSNGHPWNGWVAYLDEKGEPIEPYSFRAGAWWELMEHLAKCKRCREANGVSLDWVKTELRAIEEEWKSVTGE